MYRMLEGSRGGIEDHVILLGSVLPVVSIPGILPLGQLLVSPDLLPALPGGLPDVLREVLDRGNFEYGDGVVKCDPRRRGRRGRCTRREGGGRRGRCRRRSRRIASPADGLAARSRNGNGIDQLRVFVLVRRGVTGRKVELKGGLGGLAAAAARSAKEEAMTTALAGAAAGLLQFEDTVVLVALVVGHASREDDGLLVRQGRVEGEVEVVVLVVGGGSLHLLHVFVSLL